MKTLVLFIFMALPCIVFSQTADSVYQYCEIQINGKGIGRKVTIEVDYGQEQKLFDKNAAIKDANGKTRIFNSVSDALNYMGSLGWRVVQVFTTSSDPSIQTGYHYLMESRKKLN